MPDETEVAPLSAGTEAEIMALPAAEPEPKPIKGRTYTRLEAFNASVRPMGGYLALGVLLVVPTVALFVGMLDESFKLFWASVSPLAGGLLMYFYKSREAEKAAAQTNGGAS